MLDEAHVNLMSGEGQGIGLKANDPIDLGSSKAKNEDWSV
jgi:hypothetical protein